MGAQYKYSKPTFLRDFRHLNPSSNADTAPDEAPDFEVTDLASAMAKLNILIKLLESKPNWTVSPSTTDKTHPLLEAADDPRIPMSNELIEAIIRGMQDGVYHYSDTEYNHYTPCLHKIKIDIDPGDGTCICCNGTRGQLEKQKVVNDNLGNLLHAMHNARLFHWPQGTMHLVSKLWLEVYHKLAHDGYIDLPCKNKRNKIIMVPSDLTWLDWLNQDPEFKALLCMEVTVHHLKLPNDNTTKEQMNLIEGAMLDPHYAPAQRLLAPLNSSAVGIVTWSENPGDYLMISNLGLPTETAVEIACAETQLISQQVWGRRCGAAVGHYWIGYHRECQVYPLMNSAATRDNYVVKQTTGSSCNAQLSYFNEGKKKAVHIKAYRSFRGKRSSTARKRLDAKNDGALRKKYVIEGKDRLQKLIVLCAMGIAPEPAGNLFGTFAKAVVHVMNGSDYFQRVPGITVFERVFLEWMCGTGEMRNHQAVYAHTDGNPSHPMETMMIFGKVAFGDTRSSDTIVREMKPGMLVLPFQGLAVEIACCTQIVHCRLKNTMHLADFSRNIWNWSWVHGP